jgi:hypothetical protein
MAMPHRVHGLLHFEARIQIPFGPMEFDISVGEKIDFSGIGSVIPLSADDCVLIVGDGTQFEKRSVKFGKPRQIICAEIHMMELEVHFYSLLCAAGFCRRQLLMLAIRQYGPINKHL